MNQISVLDHGYVRLVDSMGSDLSVVRAARVSYDAAWRAGEDEGSDARLINYLWKNGHTSPFEAVTFTFEVYAPIFVFRQWHRHRTWSFNELSARYKELPEVFYVPKAEHIGTQSISNKQGRTEDGTDRDYEVSLIQEACESSFAVYNYILSQGVPRELARGVLPMNTYSHMFATVNLLNLKKFIGLRDHDHAQFEIREYAKALKTLAATVAPVCMEK
jgi:thymidylate synthase (FAD)